MRRATSTPVFARRSKPHSGYPIRSDRVTPSISKPSEGGSGMAENVEALKKGFDGFNQGDADAVAEVFDDDVKWEGPNTQEVPGGGTFEGKEKVLEMVGGIQEDWEEFQATPDEFIDASDTVIVLGHVTGKHKESGNELKTPFV